jgi:hypothetical protein
MLSASGERPPAWVAVAALTLATLVFGGPVLIGRVVAGHDLINYLVDAQQTAANLREGLLFPAWGSGYNADFGAPRLIFIPPLLNYLHALARLGGLPIVTALCWLALLVHLGSGLLVWGWLRSTGAGSAALPAALVYQLAPYRFIDLYSRTALGEHGAFLWLPAILWAMSCCALPRRRQAALVGVLVAALLLTNLPLAVLFGVLLAVWLVSPLGPAGRRMVVGGGAGLGFAIATFALWPQALASRMLDVSRYVGADAGRFRPSANTLFRDGLDLETFNTRVSLALVVTALAALGAFAVLDRSARRSRAAWVFALAAVGCVLAATAAAGPLWDSLPLLSKLQFPWRVTAVVTFLAAMLVARLPAGRAWLVTAAVGLVALPFAGWQTTMPGASFRPPKPPPVAPGTVFPDPAAVWEANSSGWYWRHHTLAEMWMNSKTMPRFLLSDIAGQPARPLDPIRRRPAVLLEAPETPIEVLEWRQKERRVRLDAPRAGTLLWRVIDFPEMSLAVDGAPTPSFCHQPTGLVAVRLPAGEHSVTWRWRPFPGLRSARLVTLVALLLTVALAVVPERRGQPSD